MAPAFVCQPMWPCSCATTCCDGLNPSRGTPLCVQALIRPWRLGKVVQQLNASGIRGMTVQEVKGAGVQGGEHALVGGLVRALQIGILIPGTPPPPKIFGKLRTFGTPTSGKS